MKYFTKISSAGNEPAPSKSGLSPLSVGGTIDDGKDEFWRKFKEKARYDRNIESLAQEGKGDQMSRVFTDRMANFSLPDPDPLIDLGKAQINAFKYNKLWDPVGDKNNLSYLLKHKYYVYDAGRDMQMPVGQLLAHDNSKFLPSEWMSYRNFFQNKGQRSSGLFKKFRHSVDEHYSLNPHHIAYWGSIDKMPLEFKLEALADWYAVGKARGTEMDADFKSWFMRRRNEHSLRMDEATLDYIQNLLDRGEKVAEHKFIKQAAAKTFEESAQALEAIFHKGVDTASTVNPSIHSRIRKMDIVKHIRNGVFDSKAFASEHGGAALNDVSKAIEGIPYEHFQKHFDTHPLQKHNLERKFIKQSDAKEWFKNRVMKEVEGIAKAEKNSNKRALLTAGIIGGAIGIPLAVHEYNKARDKEAAWFGSGTEKGTKKFINSFDQIYEAGRTASEGVKETSTAAGEIVKSVPKSRKIALPLLAGAGLLTLGYAAGKHTPKSEEEYKMAEHKFIKETKEGKDKKHEANESKEQEHEEHEKNEKKEDARDKKAEHKFIKGASFPGGAGGGVAAASGIIIEGAHAVDSAKKDKKIRGLEDRVNRLEGATGSVSKTAGAVGRAVGITAASAGTGAVLGELYDGQSATKGAIAGALIGGGSQLAHLNSGSLDKVFKHFNDLSPEQQKIFVENLKLKKAKK